MPYIISQLPAVKVINCWKGFKIVLNPGAIENIPDWQPGDGKAKKEAYDNQMKVIKASKQMLGPFDSYEKAAKALGKVAIRSYDKKEETEEDNGKKKGRKGKKK